MMRPGTGKIVLFLSLLAALPGAVESSAVPAVPDTTESYVMVDSGVLLGSMQFSQFEKIWENGIFFIDTLRKEAAKYQFELEELRPCAVLIVDWEKHDNSIVLAEFPNPVKARFLQAAAADPETFSLRCAPETEITVLNSNHQMDTDYVVAFIDENTLAAGRTEALTRWLGNYRNGNLREIESDAAAYCMLKMPEKSGSDFVDLMLGGVDEVEAELTVTSEKIGFSSVWHGRTVQDMQTALDTLYNLGVGMFFGGAPEVADELRKIPRMKVTGDCVHFDLEIPNKLFEQILQALAENFAAQKYMVDYGNDGW